MLIANHRHTDTDLRLWAELETADRIHGGANALARKVARAQSVIRKFASDGDCYVATSWGKDATVTAHLVVTTVPQIPLVYIAQPDADPTGECDMVGCLFLLKHPATYHRIEVEATGRPLTPGKPTPELLRGIAEARKITGTSRWINGLRREEKGGRDFRSGEIAGISCAPICDWSSADVFGYLAAHDLPVHPRYAMLGGGRWPRERIRVCTFGGYRGSGSGRVEWEREYYGDVLARIASK